MLSDGRRIPTNTVLVVDLCIIGCGPAGLTIAHELSDSGMQILLLERGDVIEQPTTDLAGDLEFESPHFPSPRQAIHNQFGGMAAIWNARLLDGVTPAARYLPLDPIDFESRYWIPHSGWPITLAHLARFYDRARQVCGVRPFDFHGPSPATGRPPLSSPSGDSLTRLEQLGPATVFTHQRLIELTKSQRVRVVTNAIAVEVMSAEGSDDGLATTSVRVQGGHPFTIRSRAVVLAAGAIENARLLLNSTAECPTGLGNRLDNVGRFFMDHPRVSLGHGSFSSDSSTPVMDLYEPHIADGQLLHGKLKLSENMLRREELLNGNAQILPHYLSISQLEGVRSARIAANAIRRRQGLARLPRHLSIATRHAIPMARYSFIVRYLNRPEVPGSRSDKWTGVVARSFILNYQPEQAPNRENRVTLGQGRDALGYRIARLHWQWSEIDLLSIRRVQQMFASELQASGLHLLVQSGDDIFSGAETAHHHLGTTRMHDHPGHGVVDRNCRLHGVSSLYVAGGSVFPTGGYANPTLTVVALAIRLADELKRVISPA